MAVISSFLQSKCLRLPGETREYMITVMRMSVLPTTVGVLPDVNYLDLCCHESPEQVFHSTNSDGDSYNTDDFESPKADNSHAENSDQEEANLIKT
ncbi:hypothetical protein CARUB_v10021208mg [Capsella rubella]|uniref:Uncharacterized protein n=1 Tax=Capsella rubella TaxID=81985 RepID=R0GJ93_9BRAS|nr:hypothetical protein CARUB_v10021208mg [Capsella rubella]